MPVGSFISKSPAPLLQTHVPAPELSAHVTLQPAGPGDPISSCSGEIRLGQTRNPAGRHCRSAPHRAEKTLRCALAERRALSERIATCPIPQILSSQAAQVWEAAVWLARTARAIVPSRRLRTLPASDAPCRECRSR